MKMLGLICLAGVLSSCETVPKRVEPPDPPKFTKKTVNIKKGFTIAKNFNPPIGTYNSKTNVWDLGGGTLELSGGHCSNKESGERVTVELDGITIQNGCIAKMEDGLTIKSKNVTLKSLLFLACEDAVVTTEGCENFKIVKCYFMPHEGKESSEVFKGDKMAQLNVTKGQNLIEDSIFYDAMNGIRHGLKKYKNLEGETTIRKNKFYYIGTAIQKTNGKVNIESSNKYYGVREEYKESE